MRLPRCPDVVGAPRNDELGGPSTRLRACPVYGEPFGRLPDEIGIEPGMVSDPDLSGLSNPSG